MKLHTYEKGNGEPIVFLHTGLETGITDFEEQQKAFEKDFRVIAPDLRGHGKSYTEDFDHFFEDSADDLKETLDGLGLKEVHVVGCSLGALVGLFFTRKYPSYVQSLSVSGLMPGKPHNWEEMHGEDSAMQSQLLNNEELCAQLDEKHQSDWRTIIHMAQDGSWYPFEETKNLGDIDVPILFMVGERNLHEVKGAALYPEQSDRVRVAVLPFAAHLVHDEQPELYSTILRQFLEEVGAYERV
ncbi:alpha/beta hydrolase [Halobacillus litoralis]|uniref:alpha/beta fold hydrolase n=1 Tax=Halobacillus litoralis TaxID=45668 RepID=UPI001CD497CF|nr:alpha/beta hydrolase [Halobacillus litoralis]MCA0970172.1 alpha/beta hydrolase [Halobacillus litoralis]